MSAVEEFRQFNRFFTKEVGLLDRHLLASDYTLAEARVLYELAKNGEQTSAEIGRSLNMDKAHLSRILARFTKRNLVIGRVSPEHGKHRLISLTPTGHTAFAALDQGSQSQIRTLLAPLGADARAQLIASMRHIQALLNGDNQQASDFVYRTLRPGDIGWIIHRQAVLYHEEYGWDWTYEGLACDIFGKFVANFDAEREAAWVAERGGSILGSVFLVQSEEPAIAKLRLLYVEPSARGLGIGRELVARCIERARKLGYRQLKLWTNDVLIAARRIYQAAGFRLVAEEKHHSFGHDLVGQIWVLDLHTE